MQHVNHHVQSQYQYQYRVQLIFILSCWILCWPASVKPRKTGSSRADQQVRDLQPSLAVLEILRRHAGYSILQLILSTFQSNIEALKQTACSTDSEVSQVKQSHAGYK